MHESQDVQRVARLSLDLDEVFGRDTGFRPMQFLVVLVLNSFLGTIAARRCLSQTVPTAGDPWSDSADESTSPQAGISQHALDSV